MAHRGWKRDGFTPAKKAKAVEALGKYGNVTDAARVAEMEREDLEEEEEARKWGEAGDGREAA